MINLTKEEALELLRKIGRIEGYLESVRGGREIKGDVIYVADILQSKLEKDLK